MEIWKDIKGYEGIYQVSNLGNVKSLPKKRKVRGGKYSFKKERLLKNSLNNKGYYRVNLSFFGKNKAFLIHRLVCLSFLPNPENKRTVNHKNGIPKDNRLVNLEWATDKENIDHSRDVLKNNYNDRKLKNIETGKIYKSLRFVMDETEFSKSHLCAMLKGNYPNKSKFVYI
jgi:hypothetical protein